MPAAGLVVSALLALCPPQGSPALQATLWVQRSPEYRAVCREAYALAARRLDEALADPTWTAALEQDGDLRGKEPAVVLDLDETVLDNSSYQARLILDRRSYDPASWTAWVREEKAGAVPGALEFCRYARERGVHVFYVSNRRAALRDATARNLRKLGFPLEEAIDPLRLRRDTSDKSPRRRAIAARYRILLLIGDSIGDFHGTLPPDGERRVAGWFGERWIVLPNPMYGHWLRALEGHGTSAERIARLVAALRPLRAAATRTSPAGAPPEATGSSGAALLAAGPMPAWTAMHEVAVWVQTTHPARVQLRLQPEDRPDAARLSREIETTPEHDLIALFELTDLPAGTRFSVELYLDGRLVPLEPPVRVHTQPQWRYRTDPPEFSFLVGSCLYVNDPPSDRPGKPYGGGYEILEHMAAAGADFMLWLGDNCYLREPDWLSPAGIRARYRRTRAFAPLQALLRATHHYAIWDDHDYGPNDSDRGFPLKAASLAVLRDYWPLPVRGTPSVRGAFFRFTYGDAEFFVLDDRWHRSPNDAPDTPEKVMFGEGQRRWLLDGLRSSRARFKFVACGNQMLNPLAYFESFTRFPAEQKRLFDALARERIPGLVFLSGDRHAGELLHRRWPGAAYHWYEFTVSPLTAGPGGYAKERDNPARVPGTWVTERNYGIVRVLGKARARRLVFSLHASDGHELWRHELPATALRAPKAQQH